MRHIFIISFILFTLKSFGVESPPKILRACMNFTDSIVTISWQAPTDDCVSFNKYTIYGSRESGPFNKIDDIPNINITEYPHKLADINRTWEYFITVDYLCDGISTASSDTIKIDLSAPVNIQIDSVSYDLSTQDIIAGWPTNPSVDTKVYEVYDNSSGDGDSIGRTTNNSFNISDARSGRFPVRISTIDSCSLSSLLSNPHVPSFLNASIDTCLREIALSWTRYSGWTTIDSQSLYISRDYGVTFVKDTTLNGSTNSLIFNNFILGDTIYFYIRSYTKMGTVSSSSNIRIIETRAFQVPQYIYLSLATVYDAINNTNATPSITWQIDNIQDLKTFSVLRGTTNSNLSEATKINTVTSELNYVFDDFAYNAKEGSYFYQVNGLDKCGDVLQSSDTCNTIFLEIDPLIVHNEYINWDVGVRDYTLQKHNGSTWNSLYTQNNKIANIDFSDSFGCYRIEATEEMNRFNSVAISRSNILCITKPLNFHIVTGLNTQSENNRFIILGEGIDHTRSTYSIFNRWGQKIITNNTNEPWYATYNGETVPSGSYVYVATIFGLLGEKETTKGILNVIR